MLCANHREFSSYFLLMSKTAAVLVQLVTKPRVPFVQDQSEELSRQTYMPDGKDTVISAERESHLVLPVLFSTSYITKAKQYASQYQKGLFQGTRDICLRNLFCFAVTATNRPQVVFFFLQYVHMS